MLEDRLKEARRQSAKRRKIFSAALFIVTVLCALVIIAPSFYDFTEKEGSGNSITETPEPVESEVVNNEAIRTEFKELLKQYANTLEADLGKYDLSFFDEEGYAELTSIRESMNLDVAQGDYLAALAHLNQLQSKAELLLEEAEQSFVDALEKAKKYYSEDLYTDAKGQIDFALQVMPGSTEILALQEQNEKLSTLLPILKEIQVARAEKHIQKEHDLLQQLLSLAPERTEESERLTILAKQIQDNIFKDELGAGFAAFEQGDIKKTKEHYRKAKEVAPERVELKELSWRIATFERTARVRRNVSRAEQAVRNDKWKDALKYYTQAAKEDTHNQKIISGKKQAARVLSVENRLQSYLSNPYRLTNTSVQQDAKNTLAEAQPVTSLSYNVKRKSEELKKILSEVNRPASVTIVSDNKTNVIVRGVGKVGRVNKKTIELKPGKYLFEGMRKGYKSKLVTVDLLLTQKDYSVRVICDEPI